MEIPLDRLLFGATVIFLSGMIVFIAIFRTYSFMAELERRIGVNFTEAQVGPVIKALSAIPLVLGGFYALLIIAIVWYLLGRYRKW
jgi:hypothetical protein